MNQKKEIFATRLVLIFSVFLLVGASCGANKQTENQEKAVSLAECAELMAFAPKIDLRSNDLPTSYPWTLKFYDRMAELEKKYGITQDELSKACEVKKGEPGFNEEVKRQEKKLQSLE